MIFGLESLRTIYVCKSEKIQSYMHIIKLLLVLTSNYKNRHYKDKRGDECFHGHYQMEKMSVEFVKGQMSLYKLDFASKREKLVKSKSLFYRGEQCNFWYNFLRITIITILSRICTKHNLILNGGIFHVYMYHCYSRNMNAIYRYRVS